MRGTVKRNKATPVTAKRLGWLCLNFTAPTDVGANGLGLPTAVEAAGMSGYNPDRGVRQDRRSASSVVAFMEAA
jgi:hypothetical protein